MKEICFTNDMEIPFVAKEWEDKSYNRFRLVVTKFKPPYDFEFEVEVKDTDAMGDIFWRKEDRGEFLRNIIMAFCGFYSKNNVTLPF